MRPARTLARSIKAELEGSARAVPFRLSWRTVRSWVPYGVRGDEPTAAHWETDTLLGIDRLDDVARNLPFQVARPGTEDPRSRGLERRTFFPRDIVQTIDLK